MLIIIIHDTYSIVYTSRNIQVSFTSPKTHDTSLTFAETGGRT